MQISQEAIQKILGIKDRVYLEPKEMANRLNITFYPYKEDGVSVEVKSFAKKLEQSLFNLKVNLVPYEEALHSNYPFLIKRLFKGYLFVFFNGIKKWVYKIIARKVEDNSLNPNLRSLLKIKIGKKIKKGIAVIAVGENREGNLPMDNTASFINNPIITIVDMPEGMDKEIDFHKHFDIAMNLFAHHMTNIVIAVNKDNWLVYNFNSSHPIYPVKDEEFETHLLNALIPKIFAPIKPPRFSDFMLEEERFDPLDNEHKNLIEDMVKSGSLLEETGLYPPGKLVNDLPFRNEFYKWIGKLHLDGRNGMSYGFLARQMPVKLTKLIPFNEAKKIFGDLIHEEKDYFVADDKLYIILEVGEEKFCLQVPDVWVLTQRSGSKKTKIDIQKDILKMGLADGKMFLEIPKGIELTKDFKPSFDTMVILANAAGNAITGSILAHIDPGNTFSKILENNGMALSHWHGYFKKDLIPKGWHVHGAGNPHVSCSTPQSAIYAFDGKLKALGESFGKKEEFLGDIHIEPQHGTNITFNSLEDLGKLLNNNPGIAKLGNVYMDHYNK